MFVSDKHCGLFMMVSMKIDERASYKNRRQVHILVLLKHTNGGSSDASLDWFLCQQTFSACLGILYECTLDRSTTVACIQLY